MLLMYQRYCCQAGAFPELLGLITGVGEVPYSCGVWIGSGVHGLHVKTDLGQVMLDPAHQVCM